MVVAPWRAHARSVARRVLTNLEQQMLPDVESLGNPQAVAEVAIAETIIAEHLEFFGVPFKDWEATIRAMLLEQPGEPCPECPCP